MKCEIPIKIGPRSNLGQAYSVHTQTATLHFALGGGGQCNKDASLGTVGFSYHKIWKTCDKRHYRD